MTPPRVTSSVSDAENDTVTFRSAATWISGRLLSMLPPLPAHHRGTDFALRRQLGWAAPAFAVSATLAALAGAAFRDRATVFAGLVVVAAVTTLPLLFRGLAKQILVRLEAATTEREVFLAELESAHKTKEELRGLAYHDDLTGLPNRSLLYDRLGVAITHARRQESHLAVLFLDLDGFKNVNDSLGHGSGDRVLVELATRVLHSVRAGDTVARFGGDEFIVLLDGVTGAQDAEHVAAKVLDVVQAPYRLDAHEVSIAASVGVGLYPIDGTSPDELVRSADTAMYREKRRDLGHAEPSSSRPRALERASSSFGGHSSSSDQSSLHERKRR
jgi:diguanylate cyclase (GGDEF)-like protein